VKRVDEEWKRDEQVRVFLEGIRGAIPCFDLQIHTMLSLIEGQDIGVFLDLGSGDGILSSHVLEAHPRARAVLLDFSRPMLDKAGVVLHRYSGRTEFVEADFTAHDWPELVRKASSFCHFDLIVSGYAIHHQPVDIKKRIYLEVFNLLRPGGLFVNIDHVAPPSERIRCIFNHIFLQRLKAYHEAKKGGNFDEVRALFERRVEGEAGFLSSLWEQCQWLEDLGFEEVDCFFKYFELAVFGGRRPGA